MTQAARVNIVSNNAGDLVRREHARDLGASVVVAIYRLAKLAKLHDLGNEALRRQLEQTRDAIHDYCLRAGTDVDVLFAHRAVFVAGQLLKGSRGIYDSAAELGEILAWCGGSELAITRDVTLEDLHAFAEAVSAAMRAERGSFRSPAKSIRLRPVAEAARVRGLEVERLPFEQRVVRTYASAVVIMRRFLEDLEAGRYVLPKRVKRVAQNLVDLSEGGTAAFLGVTEMRNANTDDAGRAVNAAILSVLVARQLTGDRAALAHVAMAAMMHDVGRPRATAHAAKSLGIARVRLSEDEEDALPAGTAAVLTALGRLNDASIRRTVITFEALSLRRAASIGPPYRGARQATLHARILRVVRRYNELMVPDPGLPSPAPDHAIARLSVELTEPADQTVLRMLVAALGTYPIGTALQLSGGEVVEVVKGGPRPRVRVVMDARGAVARQAVEIDLSARPEVTVLRVLGTEGWRKGEGAVLEGETPSSVQPPSQRSASISRERRVDPSAPPSAPSRPSFTNEPSFNTGPSSPSLGTTPSGVVDAMGSRDESEDSPNIIETDDEGRTVLAPSPFASDNRSVAAVRHGATAVGHIATTPVVHIFVYVLERGLTGSVELTEPTGERHQLRFLEGGLVKVKTGRTVAPLAKELVAAGLLTDAAAAMSVAQSKASSTLLGEFLVQRKLVSREDVALALARQARRKLAAIVNLPAHTMYAFYGDQDLLGDWAGQGTEVEPIGTVLAAARAWNNRARIRATLQRIAAHPMRVHPSSTIDMVDMTDAERAVLAVIREREPVLSELFAVPGLAEEAVASLAYTLAVTRHVVLPGQRGGPMALEGSARLSRAPAPAAGERTVGGADRTVAISSQRTLAVRLRDDDATLARASAASAPPPSGRDLSGPPASARGTSPSPAPVSVRSPGPPPSIRERASASPPLPAMPPPPPSSRAVAPTPPASSRAVAPPPPPSARDMVPPAPPSMRDVPPAPTSSRDLGQSPPPVSSVRELPPMSHRSREALGELRQAESFLQKKDFVAAEEHARRGMKLDPDHAEPAAFVEWVLVMAGKQTPAQAIVGISDVLQRDPNSVRARVLRAKLLKRENKIHDAIADLELALRAEPDHKDAKNELQLLKLFAR